MCRCRKSRMLEIDVSRSIGSRTHRQHDRLSAQPKRHAGLSLRLDRLRIDESRLAGYQLDAIALVVVHLHFDLAIDHRFGGASQFRERQADAHARGPKKWIVVGLGHLEDGIAKRLAGNGPQMHGSSDQGIAFDHGNRLAELGRLHGRAFAAGSGADDNEVVFRFHNSIPP